MDSHFRGNDDAILDFAAEAAPTAAGGGSDQQILFLLAGAERGHEPARALAATTPGLTRIVGIAVLGLDLAELAAAPADAPAPGKQIVQTEALRLDQRQNLVANLAGPFLGQIVLPLLGLPDQLVELILIEILQLYRHGFLPFRVFPRMRV